MINTFKFTLALVALMAMNGCSTITIIFTGTDSGPRPMTMGDAGVPMGDGSRAELDGAMPADDAAMPLEDAGTDSGPIVTVDAGSDVAEISFEPFNMRQSTILVAGPDVWQNVASYRFHSDDGIASIDVVRVGLDGDYADLTEVAIASDGLIYGTGIFPAGPPSTTLIVTDAPIAADSDGYGYFQVWVRVAYVQTNASVLGVSTGACLSGDRFRVGAYNIEGYVGTSIVGVTYAEMYGNEFIIRKTRPTLTRQPISPALVNGSDQELYRFQVSADAAGSVGLHTIVFTINPVGSTTISFDNFRIRRGFSDLPFSDYQIVDAFGRDVRSGSVNLSPSDPNHRVAVVFNYEQVVSGSGNVFTLHATTRGADAGDAVDIYFDRSTGSGATGYIPVDPLHYSLDLSPWGAPGTGFIGTASFIWSDLSETPHSDFYGVGGGSRDWTDLLYVEDITSVERLLR